MIIDHNNLHLKPVEFKQDYNNFRKGMFGFVTSSLQVDEDRFNCSIILHPSHGFKPPWISFFFTTEAQYKYFCDNTIGLLAEDHIFWQEMVDEADELKRTMKEHKDIL